MSTFNITPADLQGMISRLQQWSQQMGSMRSSMQAYTSQLQNTWRDPQYDIYVQKIAGIAKTMANNTKDLEDTANILKVLHRNLERTQAEYRAMVNQQRR